MGNDLDETIHNLAFAVQSLQLALHNSTELEAIIIMPLIEKAVTLQRSVEQLRKAKGY